MKKFSTYYILLFIGLSSTLFAGTTGKISGQIVSATSNEGLISANVMLLGTNLGSSTDINGYYSIINVPPGTFEMQVHYMGYATHRIQNIKVHIDRTTTQNVSLLEESVELNEIIVKAERPIIEKDRTHSSTKVTSDMVDQMPVTEISEIISLQPGVVNSGGLHFRGGRSREVAYLIDGVPVTNSFSQGGGNNIPIENAMVEELEVISGTFNAEYGSAQSGIVNIVTKRIEHEFHGTVKAYMGDWFSNQSDIFLGIDDYNPLGELDKQFTLSGPFLHKNMGFFISGRFNNWESKEWYERRYNIIDGWKISAYERWFREHNPSEYAASQGILIPDSLKTGDGARGPLRTGKQNSMTAKLSWLPTEKINFIYQFFGSNSNSNGGGSSRRYQPDGSSKSINWSGSHIISFKHFPAQNFFYNITLSYQHNNSESYYRKDNKVALFPGDTGIQLINANVSGFSLGSTDGFYTGKDGKGYRDLYLVKGDFNWQINRRNFIKAGFEFKQHDVNTYSWGVRQTNVWKNSQWPNQSDLNGVNHTFDAYWDSLETYWQDWESIYDTVRFVAIADSEYTLWRDYTIKPKEAALYVQDKIELGEIIINAGIRLDAFFPNEVYPIQLRTEARNLGSPQNLKPASTKLQFSPRIGLSFPISDRGAFHASYGHFFQMPAFQYMYNEPLYILNKLQLEGRTLGNADLKAEKTIAYEIGIQQGITKSVSIDITAYYKDFRNLLGIERISTIDAVGYNRFINRDHGNTKGVSIGLMSQGNDFITGGLNYTLSYANGSSSDPNSLFLIQSSTQLGGEDDAYVERKILPLNWDQRHTLNLFVNIGRPNDWSVGLISYLNSGTPYSPSFVERFDIASREYRNLGRKPLRWSGDIQGKKHFKILKYHSIIFIKTDNLLDHLNHESVFSSTGKADQIARLPENELLDKEKLEQEGHFTMNEIDIRPGYFSAPRNIQIGLEIKF
ncbi:MAG: TonB-dependent receptor [Candidatus Marinimicrobia bacterium]|jgi:outer membrane receptor protein involved in Fe transport|nr:TonB-dependent receptor [Candidatus Neomarinimicrobiota bacterium]MBT3501157.1 TonB-dependent receptor [Candidatus Neomarinimicrobiota bacterium]MBT3840457.1 TonB-dependent receptor [Candidatus Neomarinimicrobiota bacterium]MBT4000023.1 TonB-dependent receptor [Candidatus Neomarinimicrobiota bacterium]MBT4282432.1 TonB-dependent receptor [Candidatus Neomarinimicrobiota bacterium]